MDCGIYALTFGNGKRYIGSSKSIRKRFYSHLSGLRRGIHRNEVMQRAFQKYGEPVCSVLVVCREIDLIQYEQALIDGLKPDYNLSTVVGRPMLDERAREKMRRPKSESHRQKLREANLGKKYSAETREKVAAARRGKRLSQQHIENAVAGRKRCSGYKMSEEQKEKLCSIRKGKWTPPAHVVEAARSANIGRKQSDEERAMRSMVIKAWHASRRAALL